MAETFPRGRFVWHELATTDPDAAASFYQKVVGWKLAPSEQDPSYRYWQNRGTSLGGLMPLPDSAKSMGAPSNWLPYVAVPDVAATTRHAVSLGARTYVEPKNIGVGEFAVLADPQGAVNAVYRSSGAQGGHDDPANPGEFSWHELMTTDALAAWEFYHSLFGWVKTDAMDMGADGIYQMFGRGGMPLGGIYNKPAGVSAPAHWLSYARVHNADTAAAQVAKLGGRVIRGPMEVPGGDRIAMLMDPQGAAFAVHAVSAANLAAAGAATTAAKKSAPATKATAPAAKKKAAPAAKKKAAPAAKKKAAPAAKKKAAPASRKRKVAPAKKRKGKPARGKKAKKAPPRRAAAKRTVKKKGRRR